MLKIKFLISIGLVILFSSCSKEEKITQEEDITPDFIYNRTQTLQYRTDISIQNNDLVSYDVFYDENANELRPVVIWIHGGGWAIGDKANNFEDKKKYFESLGYVLFSINYRLSPVDENGEPNELLNNNRVKFPTHPQDVASAINHIYTNIETYGGNKEKIVIMGHSAGAHLSTLMATDPSYLALYGLSPKDIFKGVANFDTESYNITQHFLDFGITPTNNQATVEVDNFLDNDPLTPYHQTVITYLNAFGKNGNTWINASPIEHVNHSNMPDNFFFYYQDVTTSNQNRVNIIEEYVNALNNGTNYVVSYETPFQHEIINQRIGQSNDMTEHLTNFLMKCFN